MLRTAEYSYIIYPYILHKQQLALASGLQKRFCIWHFVFNTVQGSSSSHPFPISHLLTGLPQSTFSTCVELFLLQGYQDNSLVHKPLFVSQRLLYTTSETQTLIFQLYREAVLKNSKPLFLAASVVQTLCLIILVVIHPVILNTTH